jgi:nucleotide-binding universal stress UspA family protein
MFETVLVGVDGREGGRDAIALAKQLAAPGGGVMLAHVYSTFPGRGAIEALPIERTESQELLERERRLSAVDARLAVKGEGPVGAGLHALAEAEHADLLVIGSCHRAVLGRVLLGDDTSQTLNGAPCAVAIAPAGYAHEPHLIREIGVGYDGSPESQHALGFGRKLAGELRARLSAFEAVWLRASAYTLSGGLPPQETIDEVVDAARARVASIDGVEPHAAYGQPGEELALCSASLDLLVIGSRRHGPIGRLVHGSTAHYLTRHARCPLIVVPRSAASNETEHSEALRVGTTMVRECLGSPAVPREESRR